MMVVDMYIFIGGAIETTTVDLLGRVSTMLIYYNYSFFIAWVSFAIVVKAAIICTFVNFTSEKNDDNFVDKAIGLKHKDVKYTYI